MIICGNIKKKGLRLNKYKEKGYLKGKQRRFVLEKH